MFPLLSSRWKRLLIRSFNFAAIVGVTSGLTVFVIVGAGFLYHRARKNAKAAEDVEYPAYGVTGPGKDTSPSSGDRKLAQNAQLYHYQHTKQQMIAFDTTQDKERTRNGGNISESEDEGEEGDYTVYECPGLAPVLPYFHSFLTFYKKTSTLLHLCIFLLSNVCNFTLFLDFRIS